MVQNGRLDLRHVHVPQQRERRVRDLRDGARGRGRAGRREGGGGGASLQGVLDGGARLGAVPVRAPVDLSRVRKGVAGGGQAGVPVVPAGGDEAGDYVQVMINRPRWEIHDQHNRTIHDEELSSRTPRASGMC